MDLRLTELKKVSALIFPVSKLSQKLMEAVVGAEATVQLTWTYCMTLILFLPDREKRQPSTMVESA